MVGLSSAEAQARLQKGLGNTTNQKTSRSLSDIFISNFLNIANVILLAIIIILTLVGKPVDGFVTGGVVIINVFIGTFQEYRSKRKLDQIALLTRPKVTVIRDGIPTQIDQNQVVVGDAILFKAGDQAVVDGKMLSDNPSARVDVDESLLTGESDLILKRAGDEILSGSFAVVGEGIYLAEKVGNDSFAAKITAGAREFTLSITPLQRQIGIIVRVLVVLSICLSGMIALSYIYREKPFSDAIEDIAVVISLIPQGLLLMITVAYALGAVRIAAKGALVQQSNAVESLSNVDVLCMDKTGTLTTNRILFEALHPDEGNFRDILGAYIASTSAKNRTAEAIAEAIHGQGVSPVLEIPFSSARKWSAASFETESLKGTYILGAPEMIFPAIPDFSGHDQISELANQGLRVLLFAHSEHIMRETPDDREADLPPQLKVIGLISFSDELRPNVQAVLAGFRQANITLKVISGDNATTVAALAYQAGFDPQIDHAVSGVELAEMPPPEFEQAVLGNAIFGRITPEQKSTIVDILRDHGHYVAMMGDGVNDVLSLKKAQVGIAMEDGSPATRAVADIVLLGNKFEILPDAFLEGQRILNGMNDSTRLFLTRTVYIALLILVAGFIGSDFPFSPRHNAVLTTLPVGIPAFFLAYWAKAGQPKKSLLVSTAEFVLPAGITLFGVNIFLWILYQTYQDNPLNVARSVLTIASLLGALCCILLAEHPREYWHSQTQFWGDHRRLWLVGAMLVIFGLVMLIPQGRELFEMEIPSLADLLTIGATLLVWAGALLAIWRYDILEHLLIPKE